MFSQQAGLFGQLMQLNEVDMEQRIIVAAFWG